MGYQNGRQDGFVEGETFGLEEGQAQNYINNIQQRKSEVNVIDDFWDESKVDNSILFLKKESSVRSAEISDTERNEDLDLDKRINFQLEIGIKEIAFEDEVSGAISEKIDIVSESENELEISKYKLPKDSVKLKQNALGTKFKEFHFNKKITFQKKSGLGHILLTKFVSKRLE